MSEPGQAPSPEVLQAFAERVLEFRGTLPPEQQVLLDTLIIAALRPEWLQDVETYWARANSMRPPP
jgi:hypothetical protein